MFQPRHKSRARRFYLGQMIINSYPHEDVVAIRKMPLRRRKKCELRKAWLFIKVPKTKFHEG